MFSSSSISAAPEAASDQPETRILRPNTLTAAELASLDEHDALSIEHVSKRFVKSGGTRWPWSDAKKQKIIRAVDDVSLLVPRREIFGVLGSNGSGKSTLIRLISTLLLPDEGTVEVFGHDVVREERAVQRLINRVSVEAAFFRKLSPMENLLYSARLYGMRGGEARPLINRDPAAARHQGGPHQPAAGEYVARHAAEGGHRARVLDRADPAAAGRADDRPGPALEARRAGLHPRAARHARRHHPADHT